MTTATMSTTGLEYTVKTKSFFAPLFSTTVLGTDQGRQVFALFSYPVCTSIPDEDPLTMRIIKALADFDDDERHVTYNTVDDFLADIDARIRELDSRAGSNR